MYSGMGTKAVSSRKFKKKSLRSLPRYYSYLLKSSRFRELDAVPNKGCYVCCLSLCLFPVGILAAGNYKQGCV